MKKNLNLLKIAYYYCKVFSDKPNQIGTNIRISIMINNLKD